MDMHINIKTSATSKNKIFKELLHHQITNVQNEWKLSVSDIKRLCKYLHTSIFNGKCCVIWNGYISNTCNVNKNTYINFYFDGKKVALHRLLYSNFVEPLEPYEYLKFTCVNKGVCCNVNHYKKYKYRNSINSKRKLETGHIKLGVKKKSANIVKITSCHDRKIIVDFDE